MCALKDQRFEERTKVPNKNGRYYFTCKYPDKFYLALVNEDYSE